MTDLTLSGEDARAYVEQLQQENAELLQEVGKLHMREARYQVDAAGLQIQIETLRKQNEELQLKVVEEDFEAEESASL